MPLARLPDHVDGAPFDALPVISIARWHEVALWWPRERALVVAEAVGTAPPFALGRRAGAHPMLRVTGAPAALRLHTPEMLLVGHGAALDGGASGALEEALAHWRRDLPRLLVQIPSMILSLRR